MGQLGKYTTYVGGKAVPAHALLSTLYPKSPFAVMLSNGDEKAAIAAVMKVATSDPGPDPNGGGLQPAGGIQAGDLGMFPTGVDLTYGGSPDVSKVKWVKPGDPASGYVPDITSPTAGPGHTQGTDKTGDPTGTLPQIKTLATDEDPAGQGLKDPSSDGPAVYGANKATAATIGATKLGDSGGNV